MSAERNFVPSQGLGALQGCLVEGDPEQRRRERRIRRRALVFSVVLQSAVLLALVLVPLFAKPPRLGMTITTPVPPYRRGAAPTSATPIPEREIRRVCIVCFSSRPSNLTPSSKAESSQVEGSLQSLGDSVPIPCPECITMGQTGPRRPDAVVSSEPPRIVHRTHIDPAMLVHRVEPVYPTLAKQLGRAGKVELRAVIAADGTIHSLQVVGGDPLFYQSALDAVRQWRYQPTVLNGLPVEIDTFITVIYNMRR
jgi:periplasmic protein TonB